MKAALPPKKRKKEKRGSRLAGQHKPILSATGGKPSETSPAFH